MRTFLYATLAIALTGYFLVSGACAQPKDFYAGKTITMVVSTGVGGEYDRNLRLLQRHIGKYILGNPTILVINQVGAGGLLAINHAANMAPKDGTWLVLVMNGLLLFEATGMSGMHASLANFKWIGNFSQAAAVTVVTKKSGIRSIEDAKIREVIIGSTGAGSLSAMLPAAYNALIGTKFRMVQGYDGASSMNLAMRKGELDGRSGGTWPSYLVDFPEASKEDFIIPLTQVGEIKDLNLPNAPLLTELVGVDPMKRSVAQFISKALTQNRSLAGPDGIPDDRLAILREAFARTMVDPTFVLEAARSNMELSPAPGVAVGNTVSEVLATSKEVREYAKFVMGSDIK